MSRFKSNNEEYRKIKQRVVEVRSVPTDGKVLLQFALAAVVESLRSNPELYNFISYSTAIKTTSTTYRSNYISLISSGRQQQQSFNDNYTALIFEESEKTLYKLITELTNMAIVVTAASIRETSLPLLGNEHKLIHKNDNVYQTEEARYNNQLEIHNNDQEQPNE